MLIICSIYIISLLILLAGSKRYLKNSTYSDNLKISVITAARNEATVISEFISSLKRIIYPKDNFEIIIVDDNSADDTFKLTEKMTMEQSNFISIKAENKSVPGKRGALLKGIELSRFPFIVITDADCIVSPNWLKCYSASFEEGYEFVIGPSPLIQHKDIINNISCMENLRSQFLSFSLASLGLPYTAAARSMGFSKEAFFKIGGYSRTTETLSGDDDLLLREALSNKLKIKSFYDKDAVVYSHTKNTLKEYLNQKARHTQTSFHYRFKNKIILGVWHVLNLIMLFSPVLIFYNINFIWLFIVKMTADTAILLFVQKKFGYKFNIFQIFYLDLLYELFLVINFFNAMSGKIKWK